MKTAYNIKQHIKHKLFNSLLGLKDISDRINNETIPKIVCALKELSPTEQEIKDNGVEQYFKEQ